MGENRVKWREKTIQTHQNNNFYTCEGHFLILSLLCGIRWEKVRVRP